MRYSLLAALLAIGCSSGSPVATTLATTNAIAAAHVLIDGTAAEGTTVRGDHGATLFRVELRDRDALHLAAVQQVQLHYQLPGHGVGPRRAGDAVCYDDGTHGDDRAGDGIYHLLDTDTRMGCGRAGSPEGMYEYAFVCESVSGDRCGEMTVTVRRQ